MWTLMAVALAAGPVPAAIDLGECAVVPPTELVWAADVGMAVDSFVWPAVVSKVGGEIGLSRRFLGLRARGEFVPTGGMVNEWALCSPMVGVSCPFDHVQMLGALAAVGDMHTARTARNSVALSLGGGLSLARHEYGDRTSFSPWEQRRLAVHPTATVAASWSVRLTQGTRLRVAADIVSQRRVRTSKQDGRVPLVGPTLTGLRLGVENVGRASRRR